MDDYYVNEDANLNGVHLVHKQGCERLELIVNKKHLGEFSNCQEALEKADKFFMVVAPCSTCCKECVIEE